ncbi:hypothetical protein M409DRAFT_30428 [Zasmidium cellare ATCC 36951]|uniref:Ubiquitin-conjugating enzyme E2C-binding protein n=1 Tax=Zasmidium cellare ATCC 36951 TaxID=1080233 RepID=A0A6A6BWD1_ZASCE|nr:uncharacterized protein M409DRAFT_30428 [Zasmidium cellare ATCC 36951]KAF2159144.1 hypothetical protein M409DRAFT_30428 [Zasmidium cellare ATCC 36951]
MTIHLYAEHLVNIRTLSLQASLSTISSHQTKATLSADGNTLTLSHEGEVASIKLPIQVPGGHNDATLTIPAAPTKDLSFRVSLQEKSGADGLLTNGAHEDTHVIPWTATALTPETEIACKSCNAIIIRRGRVKIWKDLPSENWAEMMDFWHCHRPHVPHDHGKEPPQKGYSADSRLALKSGVGMVDPVDFVLAAEDCENITTSTSYGEDEALQCSSCHHLLGQMHTSSGGHKLRKAHLSLSRKAQSPFVSYGAEKWLSCHLLSSIDSQGVRKFTITSTSPDDTALKIWIFTPDINVSSSEAKDDGPMRAIKILWLESTVSPEASGSLNRQALSEGELELPPSEMELLRRTLLQSAKLLPDSAKKFQSWNVALLSRFKSDEVESVSTAASSPPVVLEEVPDFQNMEILSALTT